MTILIPTFNGRELLDVVVPSVLRQTYRNRSLLIVDDCSDDGSAEYVRHHWPQAVICRTPRNLGFAGAVNFGWRRCRSDYVALVNNDVELEPQWLGLLVGTLEHHSDAASATGKALDRRDPRRLDGAGNQMRWSGAATRRGFGERDRGQYDQPGEVISACAGYALYRHSAASVVGLFDEDLVAYYEDVDWGLRAQLAGFTCRYEPRAIALHSAGSTHGDDPRYDRLRRRNQLLVVIKNYPADALIRHLHQLLIGQLVLLARAASQGAFRRQLGATSDALVRLRPTLRKRRAVQRMRQVSSGRLERLMAPERYELWRR